jgi:phosphatidylinositol 4-kinase A
LFRSTWFYCIVQEFVRPNSEWYDSIKIIARNFSPLVPKTQSTSAFDEVLVEFDTLIKQGLQSQRLVELRRDLATVLGNKAANSLNPSECAYLDCVWNLEVLRVNSGTFQPVMRYLESYPLVHHMGSTIVSIVNRCFTLYLDRLVATPSSAQRESDLVNQTHRLLVAFVDRSAFVRKAADKYIAEILDRFPQLLWSAPCVFALLDMLDLLAKTCFDLQRLHVTLPGTDLSIVLPEIETQRSELVQDVSRLSRQWLGNALKRAPSEVSSMLQEYFGRFHTTNQAHFHHHGYSLSLELGVMSGASYGMNNKAVLSNISELNVEHDALRSVEALNTSTSSFGNALSVKAHYLGEIQGMISLLAYLEAHPTTTAVGKDGQAATLAAPAVDQLIATLVARLKNHIALRANREPSEEDEALLAAELHRAAAVLIRQAKGHDSMTLLQMVASVPVKAFTKKSMETAVFIWTWLFAARPDLGSRLAEEIRRAWDWTIDQSIGLFYAAERPASPLSIPAHTTAAATAAAAATTCCDTTAPGAPSTTAAATAAATATAAAATDADVFSTQLTKRQRENVEPHLIFIEFIAERFQVTKHSNREQFDILVLMVLRALSKPFELNCLSSALGAQFRLFLQCFRLIQANAIDDEQTSKMLRERVYLAAFAWFFHPPVWYDPGSLKVVQDDVRVLMDVCNAVQLDSRTGRKMSDTGSAELLSPRAPDVASSTTTASSTAASSSGATSTTQGASGTATSSTGGSSNNNSNSSSSNSGLPSSGSSGNIGRQTLQRTRSLVEMSMSIVIPSAPESITAPANSFAERELPKRAQLLLLLIGHELDRIVSWHNPQNTIKIPLFNEASKFTSAAATGFLRAQWTQCIRTAWKISPRLAMQLGVRFPFKKVLSMLGDAVRQNALVACMADPTAIHYLVTPEAVEEDLPELKNLLYCGSVTPPMALTLLRKEYKSHPYITQYAIRVLRTFPPETLIFYLPQLVQTLRYDKYVYELCAVFVS